MNKALVYSMVSAGLLMLTCSTTYGKTKEPLCVQKSGDTRTSWECDGKNSNPPKVSQTIGKNKEDALYFGCKSSTSSDIYLPSEIAIGCSESKKIWYTGFGIVQHTFSGYTKAYSSVYMEASNNDGHDHDVQLYPDNSDIDYTYNCQNKAPANGYVIVYDGGKCEYQNDDVPFDDDSDFPLCYPTNGSAPTLSTSSKTCMEILGI